jgi:hypothetical protein
MSESEHLSTHYTYKENAMKFTIDIPDSFIPVLGKWASVSRTLSESKRLLNGMDDLLTDNEAIRPDNLDFEVVNHNMEELEAICMALDALHQSARSEIWEAERRGEVDLKRRN